ncbi:MucR family transcriptional regulator [Nitrospirillum viridazoti]|uniref:MucR family transcriptional regulator n=1 Tax=Nitrospirillum viridazoti CBAmc TaxID=1441467 RepID=A0A248JRP8_9PROT|nr:MucR family transcriptional regulator [Nitrospirillum amazonense]ASG21375.1 MucR family transcriptional regulator [Nitrospirillum amazonense CBAmc]TWB33051.1 MucR family transcriptional regulator [Nitrospirillum amazonense]
MSAQLALPVSATALPALIRDIHRALHARTAEAAPTAPTPLAGPVPAIAIRKSVTPEDIVCLECGRRMQMLKGHLAAAHGLTPDQYRTRWGLPDNYPVTAPAYSATRSTLARRAGLGARPARRGK